jgi:RNA polymerase sigma-70 factor (ECF subfamily)
MPDQHDSGGAEVTRLLQEASRGNREAFDRLLPLVYDELREVAHGRLLRERDGHTLNTTALVHETWLRLVDQSRVEWQNRAHFFAVASEAMRRILIDYARRARAGKRGAGARHVPLEAVGDLPLPESAMSEDEAEELLVLDEALQRLAEFNPRGARVVQYRFFGGLTLEEVASVVGSSERTTRRSWTVARAWLRHEVAQRLPGRRTSLLEPGLRAG